MSSFALPSGLSSYLTGQLPSAVDNQNSQAHAQKLTEDLSVLIILVMLIIVFRAVGAPLVTLLPAVWVLLMSGRHHRRGVQGRAAGVHHHRDHAHRAAARRGHRLRLVLHHAGPRGNRRGRVGPHGHRARRPVRGRVDHVLGGHGDRGPAHPGAGLVRPVLGAGPGPRAGRRADAAGRAHPAARAARGVRHQRCSGRARSGWPRRRASTPGWPTTSSRTRWSRWSPAWCSWACWACSPPRTPPAGSAARPPARPGASRPTAPT